MRKILMVIAILVFLPSRLPAEEGSGNVYAFKADTVKKTLDDVQNGDLTPEEALAQIAKLGSSTRWAGSGAKDSVWIYVFYRDEPDQYLRLKIDEQPRQTLVRQQFGDLAKVASKIAGVASAPHAIIVRRFYYSLHLNRAYLDISASLEKESTEIKQDPPTEPTPKWIAVLDLTNGASPSNAKSAQIKTITGPREAWSISAAVPVTTLKEVKVDDSVKSIDLREKPNNFYASFDYLPRGDAFRVPSKPRDAITIKIMIKASKDPSDSFGIGVGLRSGLFGNNEHLKNIELLQIFDSISPFAAYVRSRETTTDPTGGGKIHFSRDTFIVGLSLDLKKALDWVQ